MMLTIDLRGGMAPVELDQDFTDMVNDLNVAAASGKLLVLAKRTNGSPVAIAIPNILTITEEDDSAFLGS